MPAAKKSPSELAGKYEMIKDTAGKDKRGLCMAVYPCGFFLCVVCGVADKESMDKCCCPCIIAPYCPIGGGTYMKCSADLCGPFMIVPQEDGTINGTMQGTYQKKSAGENTGAPPSSENMTR